MDKNKYLGTNFVRELCGAHDFYHVKRCPTDIVAHHLEL